jgi:transcriptional regulator with XRE-family HTH domain
MKNRLSEVLQEKNVQPIELRKHLDVDRSTVFRWLINDTQPSDENKKRISDFLNVPVDTIFFQREDVSCANNINMETQQPTGTDQ